MKFTKTKYFLFACSVIFIGNSDNIKAQAVGKNYHAVREEAFNLLLAKDYCGAAKKFKETVKSGSKYTLKWDAYNTACCFSRCNKLEEGFFFLEKSVKIGKFDDIEKLEGDSDLFDLKSNKEWINLMELANKNKLEKEIYFNKEWRELIFENTKYDQPDRIKSDSLRESNATSKEIEKNDKMMHLHDSLAQIFLGNFFESHGFPETKYIGDDGRDALFYGVQHANQGFQKKYWKMIEEAAEKDNAMITDLVLLEDRILVNEGKKQKYGTQFNMDKVTYKLRLYSIENKNKLNKLRKNKGLEPIEMYCESCEVIYNENDNGLMIVNGKLIDLGFETK
jgi:hypothetical protein